MEPFGPHGAEDPLEPFRLGGPGDLQAGKMIFKWDNTPKHTQQQKKYMLEKLRGRIFMGSAKRCRQPHRRALLGEPETSKKIVNLTHGEHMSRQNM